MVPNMGITNNHIFLSYTNTSDDPVEKTGDKYNNHPSKNCINKHMTNSKLTFTFQATTKNQVRKLESTDVPTKLTKEFCDFFSQFVFKNINHCISEENFKANLRKLNIVHFIKMMEDQINRTTDQ